MSRKGERIIELMNNPLPFDLNVNLKSSHGILPSHCPKCGAVADHTRLGLKCRKDCGWKLIQKRSA